MDMTWAKIGHFYPLTLFYLGALCAPRVIKIDRLVTKSISNVMKLIENSSNTLPKLLVPFLAIFFGSGACWGVQRGRKGPDMGIFQLGKMS